MRIEWSPGVTEEQEDKVLDHMTHEKIKEIEWAHNYPLWQEAKGLVKSYRPEVLSQLRQKIISHRNESKKSSG